MAYFSTNVSKQIREQVANILGVQSFKNPEKYLGLPNMVGKDKKISFQNLKDKMISKV